MISELFIVSSRNIVLQRKTYQCSPALNTSDIFIQKLSSCGSQNLLPHFEENGIFFFHIKRNNLYIVATSSSEISPIFVIELLTKLYHTCKDFCGIVSEESLTVNSLLIMEVLEEFMDFGWVQLAETEKIRPYINSDPILIKSAREPTKELASRMLGIETKATPSSSSDKPVISPFKDEEGQHELFIDVIEKLSVVTDIHGTVSRMEVNGTINLKNLLKGNPQVKLTLNEDLSIRREGTIRAFGDHVELDSCSFHPCVDKKSFLESKVMLISPPMGELSLMTYGVYDPMSLKMPFQMTPFIEEIKGSRDINLTVRLQNRIPGNVSAVKVILKINIPSEITNISKQLDSEMGYTQSAEYRQSDGIIVWQVVKFPGESQVIGHFRLINNSSVPTRRHDIGPYNLEFEISGFSSTGLQIKHVKILSQDKTKTPKKWLRYITVSDTYIMK